MNAWHSFSLNMFKREAVRGRCELVRRFTTDHLMTLEEYFWTGKRSRRICEGSAISNSIFYYEVCL